jgi:hypothetical protein
MLFCCCDHYITLRIDPIAILVKQPHIHTLSSCWRCYCTHCNNSIMPPAAVTGLAPIETPSYSMLFSPAASSLASPSVELQVHWEPAQIRSELRMATTILSHRGLKLAAKWASEQLVGLVKTDGTMDSSTAGGEIATMKGLHMELTQLQDRDWYAKSLLELGEYLHAASVLSQPNDDVTSMTPPLEDASTYGIYLRAYALYLAGERRKEQDYLELQR